MSPPQRAVLWDDDEAERLEPHREFIRESIARLAPHS